MEELYTERHGMRKEIETTETITVDVYRMLIVCCEKYLDNLGKGFPEYCPDGNGICGTDKQQLYALLKYRIPDLFRNDYSYNISLVPTEFDEYNQYALLDYIEYIAQNMKTIIRGSYHEFFKHYHLTFSESSADFDRFRKDINDIFIITRLQYRLSEGRQIERITDSDSLIEEAKQASNNLSENGLREILLEAIDLYKSSKPSNHHLATEKIWDALERLKTIYLRTGIDKKGSIELVLDKVSKGDSEFRSQFETEFKELTSYFEQAKKDGINSPAVENAIALLEKSRVIEDARIKGIQFIKDSCNAYRNLFGADNEGVEKINTLFTSMIPASVIAK